MHASRFLDYDNENDFHVNFLVARHHAFSNFSDILGTQYQNPTN